MQGEVVNIPQVQQGTIRLRGVPGCQSLAEEHFPIVFHAHNIRVGEGHLHQSGILAGGHFHNDLQAGYPFQQLHGADLLLEQLPCQLKILIGHIHQHFQLLVRIAAYGTKDGAGFNALHVPGGGHDDCLHVFDNVAGALHVDVLGHLPQYAPGLGRSVGDGNGFGTSQCGNNLLTKDSKILVINMLIHIQPPGSICLVCIPFWVQDALVCAYCTKEKPPMQHGSNNCFV